MKGNAVDESGNIVIPPKDIDFIATTVYKGALQMQANKNLSKEQSSKITQQVVRPTPSIVSQDVPRHSVADKIREASFAEGEKAPKDKGGY
jgi:hypothetical protein